MVKKAVPPAKKAAPATSKPASKAGAAVKAATKHAPAKTAAAKPAPAKPAASKPAPSNSAKPAVKATAKPAAKAPTAKQPAAKSAPSSTPVAKQAKQPPKESVKQPTAEAPDKASTKPTEAAAAAAPEPKRASAAKKAAPPATPAPTLPPVKGETKEGIKYTKDFDAKFLQAQHKLLIEARESLTGQAVRLEDEANSLIDDEMGDVQFDDESGEGDTMVVERERDLFLSARARQDIEEIDNALHRLELGTYGYSVVSMRPIPRERLEAIPWATELTEEKVGGIGRR